MTDLRGTTTQVRFDDEVDGGRERRRLTLAAEAGVGLALVVLVVVFAALEPTRFATLDNLRNVATDASVLIVLAMATTFVIVSRNLDLSIGGVIAFCEVVAAKLMTADGGAFSSLIGLAVALCAGLAWGLVNGALVTRTRIPPFVTTLATLSIAQGAAYVISDGIDIGSVPLTLVSRVGIGTLGPIPVLTVIAAVVVGASVFVLRRTRFGRYTYAVGSDPLAAARAGIDVGRHITKVYAIAGTAYGLAAFLNLARFSATNIGGHGADALNAITVVALGGVSLFGGIGSALGSVIGVFIPAVLRNGLVILAVQPYWQQIAVGVALLVAIGFDQRRRSLTNSL